MAERHDIAGETVHGDRPSNAPAATAPPPPASPPPRAVATSLKAWGQLLRLPNLLTVPGDPLAGAGLAAATGGQWEAVLAAAASSVLLYCAGLVHNDLCDLPEDRRQRPHRPLPSGRIGTGIARVAAVAFFAGGIAAAALAGRAPGAVAAVLAGIILLYNRFTKHWAVVGPVNMGLCRGLSVLLGAAAAGTGGATFLFAVLGAIVITAYIAAVTAIAAAETTGRPVGWRRNLPAVILAFVAALAVLSELAQFGPNLPELLFLAMAAFAIVRAARCAIELGVAAEPARVQRTVGRLIRGLVPIQAAMLALCGLWGMIAAAALMLLALPGATLLGRKFYAS